MKKKNALRKHWIAVLDETDATKLPTDSVKWIRLAKNIPTIEDDSDEESDDEAYYDGDGSKETVFSGRSEKWNVSDGLYDPEDPAMKLIGEMKRADSDDGHKLWHRIDETDGKSYAGIARALEIKAGSGDAGDYEEFSCTLAYTKTPQEIKIDATGKVTWASDTTTPPVGGGDGGSGSSQTAQAGSAKLNTK